MKTELKLELVRSYKRGWRAAINGESIAFTTTTIDSAFAHGYRQGQAAIVIMDHSAERYAEERIEITIPDPSAR